DSSLKQSTTKNVFTHRWATAHRLSSKINFIHTEQPNCLSGLMGSLQTPKTFALYQNYPNPFNPETHLRFDIQSSTHATLKVFDMLGREVTTLIDDRKAPGEYIVKWNPRNGTSSTYFYRLEVSDLYGRKQFVTKKMTYIK
ncbi:MAG: T9SS type A sorting domain-containing protein, partial [Ignavibacteria bacterium]|nr:T9SS type A sorting domain-containing protein [Ignavibacteria bacterium]